MIRSSVKITYPWKVSIGSNTWLGDYVELYSLGEIAIGSDVVISQKSYICAATHDYSKPSFDMVSMSVIVQDQVWIATDVFVALGVTISHGAIISA